MFSAPGKPQQIDSRKRGGPKSLKNFLSISRQNSGRDENQQLSASTLKTIELECSKIADFDSSLKVKNFKFFSRLFIVTKALLSG